MWPVLDSGQAFKVIGFLGVTNDRSTWKSAVLTNIHFRESMCGIEAKRWSTSQQCSQLYNTVGLCVLVIYCGLTCSLSVIVGRPVDFLLSVIARVAPCLLYLLWADLFEIFCPDQVRIVYYLNIFSVILKCWCDRAIAINEKKVLLKHLFIWTNEKDKIN